MPTPRRLLIDQTETGYYHIHARCVRQAFLCGGDFEHRRAWIEERARELASIFAIDVCKFAILTNHFHVILRNQPDVAAGWSARELRNRWRKIFPGSALLVPMGGSSTSSPVDASGDHCPTSQLRKRLCDISWFMRALCEYVARRANLEEGRKGRFWEGRFKSIRILDEEGLLQCSMYVDLNEVRAGIAETPETSTRSSVHNRILVRQMHEKRRGERSRARSAQALIAHPNEVALRSSSARRSFRSDEGGIWLVPIERASVNPRKPLSAVARRRAGLFDMTLAQYMSLLDSFGRIIREGKGAIAAHLEPILERLRVDRDHLTAFLTRTRDLYGTVAGAATKVKKEALRRSQGRAVSVTHIA